MQKQAFTKAKTEIKCKTKWKKESLHRITEEETAENKLQEYCRNAGD